MKLERGMGTLISAFSVIAALMCLLMGLQLLSLESRISLEAAGTTPEAGGHYRQWESEVRTGAVMSFGAGFLILLFGLGHQATRRRERIDPARSRAPEAPDQDADSWSIRIFEVDEDDRSVEITSGEVAEFDAAAPLEPPAWAPLAEEDSPLPSENPDDPADSILNSIREAADSAPTGLSRRVPKSFWARIFRPRSSR